MRYIITKKGYDYYKSQSDREVENINDEVYRHLSVLEYLIGYDGKLSNRTQPETEEDIQSYYKNEWAEDGSPQKLRQALRSLYEAGYIEKENT